MNFGSRTGRPKLLAQPRDMNVHRTVEDLVMAVTDLVQERFARFDAAFGARQAQEQIELDRRQPQRLVAQNRHSRPRMDTQETRRDFLFFGLDGTRRTGAPYDRA